jgi:hypothetical protein
MHKTKPRKKIKRSGAALFNKGMMKKTNIKRTNTLNVEHTQVYKFESDCCVAHHLKSEVVFKP